MAETIRDGRPGTAMKPFRDILSTEEIRAVARYAYTAFARCGSAPAGYHTIENGWTDHESRYEAAYPYVLGRIPADRPDAELNADERRGRELYRRACVICHEKDGMRSAVIRTGDQEISYGPEGNARPEDSSSPEFVKEAGSEYREEGYGYGTGKGPHDRPPNLPDLTPFEDRGEHLYLDNCAYCHAGDGTGMNWIGTFLQPHPPDFTDARVTARYSDESMRNAILDGLPDTSMPAFRSVLEEEEVAAVVAYMKRAFLAR